MFCPNCGIELNKEEAFCHNCGANISNYQENIEYDFESQSQEHVDEEQLLAKKIRYRNGIIVVLCFILLVAALVGVIGYSSYQEKLAASNTLYKELDAKYTDLKKTISSDRSKSNNYDNIVSYASKNNAGYGSSSYYANKSLLVIKKGSSKTVTVTSSKTGTIYFSTNNNYCSGKWDDNWKNNSVNLTITANLPGVTEFTFTRDADSTTFSIIVIVNE